MKKITVINTEIEIADVTTATESKVKVCKPENYALDVEVKDRAMIANMLYYMHVALIAYNGKDAYYITNYSQFQEALTNNYPIDVRYSTVVDRLREIKSNLTFHEMQEFGDFFLASMPASMKDMLVHMTGERLRELYEKFEEDRRAKYPDFYRFKDFIVTSWNDPFNDFLTSMPTPEMTEDMYGAFTAYQKQLQNEEDDKKRAAEKEKDGTTDEAGKLEAEESCVIPEDVDREFIIRDLLKMNALLTAKDNEGETFFITDNALAIEAIRNRYQVSVRCPRLVEAVRGIRKKGADMVHFSMFVRKASKGRFVDLTAEKLESLYNEFTKEAKEAPSAEPATKVKDETCENVDRCRLRRAIIRIPEDRPYGVGVPINRDGRVLRRAVTIRIKAPDDKYHAIPNGDEDHAAIAETLFRMKITLVVNPGNAGNDYYISSANELRIAIDKGCLIGVRYPSIINTVRRIRRELTEDELLLFTDFVFGHRKVFVNMDGSVLESYYNRFLKEVRTSEAKPDPKTEDPRVIPEDGDCEFTKEEKAPDAKPAAKAKDETCKRVDCSRRCCAVDVRVKPPKGKYYAILRGYEDHPAIAEMLFRMKITLVVNPGKAGNDYYITSANELRMAIDKGYLIGVRYPGIIFTVRRIRRELTEDELLLFTDFVLGHREAFVDMNEHELEEYYNRFLKEVNASEAKFDPQTEDQYVIPEDEKRADTARALFYMNILLTARKGDGGTYYITDSSLLESAIAEHHQIIIRDPYLLAKVREISTEMTDVEMMDLGKFISRKMKNYGFNDLTVEALGFLYNEFKNR